MYNIDIINNKLNMIHKLEKVLYEKTKDSQSDILYTQWIYDKKLVPRALSLISGIFPHYSMHDQSHSETIINNIVRIVGVDTIETFTAIDIWLLLTSAYYHDIGMAIPADKIEAALTNKEFLSYMSDIRNDVSHPLYTYAIQFKEENQQLVLKENYFDISVYDSIKFLLADYFRKMHAKRSEQIIINPEKEISLNSPRGIIPQRLIKILGAICASHTENFDKVLELPKNEVGIDIEDAHPRYIACLLRLGDLLDLDNNRFSDVFLRSVKSIPKDSLLHKEKHFSISHFSVDTTEIDIIANCDDYNVASVTQMWFEYIRKEVIHQMLNWNNIVPNKSMGYLPTIKNLKVELNTWQYIHDKEKPTFKVDNEQALQLLKGAGLYQSPWQCIREILQNSADASYIRLWLEKDPLESFSTPNDENFHKAVKRYPINVKIENITKDKEEHTIEWLITIEDLGLGISINDLKFLSVTGSSKKNKDRNTIIQEMPEWLQPSGEFGIGFQSIFMITDLVNIKTKSFIEQQYLEIELSNPDSDRQGDILIRKGTSTYRRKPGTIISFKIKTDPILTYGRKNSLVNSQIKAYKLYRDIYIDPFENKHVSVELRYIIHELHKFAQASWLDIYLEYNGDRHLLNESKKKDIGKFQFYNKEEQIQFSIKPKDKNNETIFYYKGQKIDSRIDFRYLCFDVNILKHNAKDIVSLDRNYLKYEFEFSFYDKLVNCIMKEIHQFASDESLSMEQRCMISMFVNYYWKDEYEKFVDKDQFQEWKQYKLKIDEKNYTINELLTTIKDVYIYDYAYGPDTPKNTYKVENEKLYIYDKGYDELGITRFLYHIFKIYFPYIAEDSSADKKCRIYHLSKGEIPQIINQERLLEYLSGGDVDNEDEDIFTFTPANLRYIIPCEEKYKALKLKNDEGLRFVDTIYFPIYISESYPKMISPFIFKKDEHSSKYVYEDKITEQLIDWVKEHNDNSNITKEEIQKAYDDFIKEYKEKLSKIGKNSLSESV